MQIKGELFSGEFIPKLLDGTKIRTSRPIKPQPICYGPNITFKVHSDDFFLSKEKGWLRCRTCGHDPEYSREGTDIAHYYKPKYQPRDIIYVRETFAVGKVSCGEEPNGSDAFYISQCVGENDIIHKEYAESQGIGVDGVTWKPSLHMPKKAARIFLTVTDVKVQRLDDLTEQDAIDDGFEAEYHGWSPTYDDPDSGGNGDDDVIFALDKFKAFWESKYGPDAQWMWAYYFERCEKPEGR